MSATEQAVGEGLELVRCQYNRSGFRCVNASGGLIYAVLQPTRRYHRGRKVPCTTPEEAALVVARDRGTPVGTTCDCGRCMANAAPPPAAAPLTKEEVEKRAADEGLTLALAGTTTSTNGGYKYVVDRTSMRCEGFAIRFVKLEALRAASPNFVPPNPNRFTTAHEAALALARLLGPDGSAEHAVVKEPLTEEAFAECMGKTANGEAFGGMFGGFTCEGLSPPLTPNPGP